VQNGLFLEKAPPPRPYGCANSIHQCYTGGIELASEEEMFTYYSSANKSVTLFEDCGVYKVLDKKNSRGGGGWWIINIMTLEACLIDVGQFGPKTFS